MHRKRPSPKVILSESFGAGYHLVCWPMARLLFDGRARCHPLCSQRDRSSSMIVFQKELAMKPSRPFLMLALWFGLLLAGLCQATAVSAQQVTPKDLEEQAKQFTQTAEMIPMRDGVKLHTTIYAPKDQKAPLPFILMRTPYGIESRGSESVKGLPEGSGRRGLHLRLSGHSRPPQVRGAVRDDATAARSEGRQGHRRRHRH